jgi:dipeptidyl aminopeptidase/acylaminoacyl peptidase
MRRRLIFRLGVGVVVATAAIAAIAPPSGALERRPTCGTPGWVPRELAPFASANGQVLAWSSQTTPATWRVFVSAADGSGVRPVSVPGPVNDRLWAIAPDGSQVLILRGGVGGGLILATTRGTEWRFVTQDEWSNLLRLWRAYPWSPDGRFQVYAEGSTLLVVPAEGGPARRIATAGTLWNESPIWSPDGEWIAFDGFIDTDGWTHAELYVVRADGSALRRLTKGRHVREQAWSPDGSLIAFGIDETDVHLGRTIGVVQPNGSRLRFLTKRQEGPDHRSAYEVSWVDSRTLAFISYQQRSGPQKVVDVHTIGRDGRGERRVTYQCHLGSSDDDRLSGSIFGDTIRTFAGDDEIAPGPGADDVDAGSGNDVVQATRDGTRDLIRCGPGRDTVVADRRDRMARDCERVIRRLR